MPLATIPRFLLPRGFPFTQTLRTLQDHATPRTGTSISRLFSSTPTSLAKSKKDNTKPARVLGQPDKFRPPSHPQRRVNASRSGEVEPVNYPGPPPSAKEREEQKYKQYPNMFPPEGTVMYKFLTSRWIHIWIALSILTSLAIFTFTTNFKRTSPFVHLLPPWSGLLSQPVDTISQALSVYRMHVEHESRRVREKRLRRVEDVEKRRQFRVAHALEEPNEKDKASADDDDNDDGKGMGVKNEYVDWEGRKRPVKKWLGIW